MSRGRYPVVAIGEAQRKAQAQGFVLIHVETDVKLPFDFVISDKGCISIIRVRRLKYATYRVEEIERLCDREIAELRQPGIPEGIFRELWVRGPDRNWHRYLVLPDAIEILDPGDDDVVPDEDSLKVGSGKLGPQGSNDPDTKAPGKTLPDDRGTETKNPDVGSIAGKEPVAGASERDGTQPDAPSGPGAGEDAFPCRDPTDEEKAVSPQSLPIIPPDWQETAVRDNEEQGALPSGTDHG